MNLKKIIFTAAAPAPIGPYSQAVKAGPFYYFSGQIALHPESGILIGRTAAEQTAQIMKNIKTLLDTAGLEFSHVVKTSIFIKDMDDFAAINKEYANYFSSDFPARETVEVSRLPKDALVEISIVAYKEN